MTLYKARLSPLSAFATRLKGDTFFGQLCWSIVHQYGSERLSSLLKQYDTTPFLVVSDAFASGFVPKPTMPSKLLGEDAMEKKHNRKKIWLNKDDLLNGNYAAAVTDKEAKNQTDYYSEVHNAINYKTFTTDHEGFAPYSEENIAYGEKDIYFLLDEEQLSFDELKEILLIMGEYGYGKKSSIGKGRFICEAFEIIDNSAATTSYMTLNPSRLPENGLKNAYYDTFVRFGKMGGSRAHKNVFKKPLLLADTAAVLVYDEVQNIQYVGEAIQNVSTQYSDAVHQGYAVVLPMKEVV